MNPATNTACAHRRQAVIARMLALLFALVLAAGVVQGALASSVVAGSVVYSTADGLYVLTAGSSAANRIWVAPAGAQAQEPRWSPDGTRIAFVGPDGNIWIISADGSSAHAVTSQAVRPSGCGEDSCTSPGASTDSPRWSPDGSLISYRLVEGWVRASVWTAATRSDGAPTLVYQAEDMCMFNEGFTPRGAPLFSRCAASAGPSNATYMGAGAAQQPLIAGSQISFSSDGARIAFSSQAMGANGIVVNLYIAAADGSGARIVAPNGQSPAWSRAGMLAYQVGDADGWTVHVLDPATGNDAMVGHGQLGGWTADGASLYLTTSDDTGSWIMLVRADGTGMQRLAAGDSPSWSS